MIMNVVEIQKILPHRYPFLFVDAVVEMERLKSIVSVKNVTMNEAYFQGHFPGAPVMPLFCGSGWSKVSPARCAGRSIEGRDEGAFVAW